MSQVIVKVIIINSFILNHFEKINFAESVNASAMISDDNAFLLHRTGHGKKPPLNMKTATAGSDVVQSGRPIFDDFFQHVWPLIGNNTANVVFQMVKRLWLIHIDQ
ncbi:hypothetical protein TNCV_4601761 [Trichonephila clavipes]|nr:hypothetical protein TNCV_4601761 [Trichonephila clavipes]